MNLEEVSERIYTGRQGVKIIELTYEESADLTLDLFQ